MTGVDKVIQVCLPLILHLSSLESPLASFSTMGKALGRGQYNNGGLILASFPTMGKALGRGQYNNGGLILHFYSYIFGKEMAEKKNSKLGQGRTEL